MTNKFISSHFKKGYNSRDAIHSIEENDWKQKKKAKKLGIEIDSEHSEEKYIY
jgi:hypothetical protein